MPPSFSDSKNLGAGLNIPFFWSLGLDKNFTLNNKVYLDENPLFFGEYHQAFKNLILIDLVIPKVIKKLHPKKVLGKNPTFFLSLRNHLKGKMTQIII